MIPRNKSNFRGCHPFRDPCLQAFLITEHNREVFGEKVFHCDALAEVAEIRAGSMEVRFSAIFR
jgi:hypothetical protein